MTPINKQISHPVGHYTHYFIPIVYNAYPWLQTMSSLQPIYVLHLHPVSQGKHVYPVQYVLTGHEYETLLH